MGTPVQSIPIRPNAGKAIGEVRAVEPHPKRAQDAVISLFVQRAEDIAGLPNFVAPEAGRAIRVTVRRGRRLELRAGARVQLTVRFEGDERGGGFYANAADFQPLESPDA
jgi:hypothetical protein